MILNALRQAVVVVGVTLALLSSTHAAFADDFSEVVGRMTDPRFDLDRYGRAYTKTMRVMQQFIDRGCIDESNLDAQKSWTDYGETIAKLLHQYASRVEYDEPNVDPALRQRQEALDMASRLIGAYTTVRKLPACPPHETSPTPKPPEAAPPPEDDGDLPPGIPPDHGQLTKEEMTLLKCATPEERERVQAYQRAIEGLKRELAQVEKPADEADAEAKRADDEAYRFRSSATEEEAKSPTFQAKLEELDSKAQQLKAKAYETRREIQPRVDELNGHINDTDRELRDLLDEIRARGSCPPPANGNTGFLGGVLDNVTIGVGVGGHHEHRGDHGDRPPPPPHD